MENANGIVVVPDGENVRAGSFTWWRLAGVIHYDKLEKAWQLADMPMRDLPSLPSRTVALKRALDEQYRGSHTLVRVLPAGGYAIVDESFENGQEDDETVDPTYETRFKAWFDEDLGELCFRNVDGKISEDEMQAILSHFKMAQKELTHQDLSSWLSKLVRNVQSVRLRDTGGIYFIPEQHVAQWEKISDIVAEVGQSRVFGVPALRTDRAVEAIMDAVISDTTNEIETVTKLLDDATLGVRALKTRGEKLAALSDKLKVYENLLGVRLDEMREKIQEADARISETIITLQEDNT